MSRWRLFWALLGLAAFGFAAATPYFAQFIRALALKSGKALPPLPIVLAGQGFQVLLGCALMIWAGLACRPRTGLSAPLLEQLVGERTDAPRLTSLLPRALLWGTLGSFIVLGLHLALGAHLPDAMRLRTPDFGDQSRPLAILIGASSLFYGGIVEELLMRWGLLALLMTLALKLGAARGTSFWIANALTALVFGAGHLPTALQLGSGPVVIGYVIVANACVGFICGALFRKRGLEQAMLAHGWADVCLHAVPMLL
ncbi:MAG: CPBP family intramembrane metalloprotease [Deltaproteobacteria bacterium]|nr:CPBP family intramembrane metalloprotease [Deltaproteobacteria bacterium]